MTFKTFEERLENWSRVVRYSGGGDDTCALWAKWYVLLRDLGKGDPRAITIKNELDGWAVERAWRSMPNHVAKWVLKYHYVWNFSPEQIDTRMRKRHGARVRKEHLEHALANGRQILSREIIRIYGDEIMKIHAKEACKQFDAVL